MKNSLSIIFIAISLLGCSSKPDIGDVEKHIQAEWKSCKLLKVTDLEKTNGFDKGNTYQLTYSYNLEPLTEFRIGGSPWVADDQCPVHLQMLLWQHADRTTKNDAIAKKGVAIKVNSFSTLVKSENGWVIQ